MPILSAENSFKRGLAALIDDNVVGATVQFRRALEIERQRSMRAPDRRYLSYYGYSLARTQRSPEQGLRACRAAVIGADRDPELWLNLGRVYNIARRTSEALESFDNGLRINPSHTALRRERERLAQRLGLTGRGRRRGPGLLSRMVSPLLGWLGVHAAPGAAAP